MPTLFETKVARGRTAYKVYAATVLAGTCSIFFYRLTHFPESGVGEDAWKWWCWLGMLAAEFWFGFYWVVTQSLRWNPTYSRTFKETLSKRYEKKLPPVDVFVCTADPTAEPPLVVVCTVLSVMAYDYPPEKLSVYLSDDGGSDITFYASVRELEERAKAVVTCTFEDNTEWGKEVGLKYGCVVEDIITGLAIQCRGWRSVAFNPTDRPGFLGLAPTNMVETLVQHKRWSEGNLQIFLSKHCSFVYGHGKITLGHQMAYGVYGLWATNCFPTLCYVVVPPLCLLKGFSLFPEMTNPWCLIMLYVIISKQAYSLMESLMCGDTLIGWWNSQRMWLFKRLTSYLFGSLDVFRNRIGISESSFVVTAKGKNNEATRKYEKEVMDLGGMPPMFTIIIAFVALLNLFCLAGGIKRVILEGSGVVVELFFQVVVCIAVVVISFPVYVVLLLQGKENGIPRAVVGTSVALAFLACLLVV